jgi:hypothetical protein
MSASIALRVLGHVARKEAMSLSVSSSRATSWLSYRSLSEHASLVVVKKNILRWGVSEMLQSWKEVRQPWFVQVRRSFEQAVERRRAESKLRGGVKSRI